MSVTEAVGVETRNGAEVLLEVSHLKMYFPITQGLLIQRKVGDVQAVDGLNFWIRKGRPWDWFGRAGAGRARRGGRSCSCTGRAPGA